MPRQKIEYKSQQLSFRSGEKAPVSAIWRMEHANCVRVPDLWVRIHEPFPACPACGACSNFTLVEEVAHISEDSDFQ